METGIPAEEAGPFSHGERHTCRGGRTPLAMETGTPAEEAGPFSHGD